MPATRLTFDEVRLLVAGLSTRALGQLMEGPLPDDKAAPNDCRVCMVLGGLTQFSNAAAKLKEWHEFWDETEAIDELSRAWRNAPEPHLARRALVEWRRIAGELSYARNATIYALAQVELLIRAADEPEEPDDRDPGERRQDEEAEEAERRLDAEKVGDL